MSKKGRGRPVKRIVQDIVGSTVCCVYKRGCSCDWSAVRHSESLCVDSRPERWQAWLMYAMMIIMLKQAWQKRKHWTLHAYSRLFRKWLVLFRKRQRARAGSGGNCSFTSVLQPEARWLSGMAVRDRCSDRNLWKFGSNCQDLDREIKRFGVQHHAQSNVH